MMLFGTLGQKVRHSHRSDGNTVIELPGYVNWIVHYMIGNHKEWMMLKLLHHYLGQDCLGVWKLHLTGRRIVRLEVCEIQI